MNYFLFVFSKVFWFFARIDNLLIFALFVGLVLSRHSKYGKTGRRVLVGAILLLAFLSYLPIANWVLSPLEGRFPAITLESLPDDVDGVIVLGGGIEPEPSAKLPRVELNAAADRVLYFYALSRKYPEAKLVYATGSGSVLKQGYKESLEAEELFRNFGMSLDRIVLESESKNTVENGQYSKKIVNPKPEEKWILLTSAFHMPRSVGVFRKLNWGVIPFPVDFRSIPGDNLFELQPGLFKNSEDLLAGLKEWIGLVAYYVLGRTSSLFPGPQ